MTKALIITEKPSVARDLAQALGGFTARDSGAYLESEQYVVSFAVGHLLELLAPEDIDPALKSWRFETLPIVPKRFELKPIQGHEKRLAVLRRLAERSDVDRLINACDAAREGELIFREIVGWMGSRKGVRRLWLQSMTTSAIRTAFDGLRDGKDLDGLGAAAECRARADWLIGMNATRAFSIMLRSPGRSPPWSVGRVQTPTLALLVAREMQILGHRPKDYWRLVGKFEASGHVYEGVWFDPALKSQDTQPEVKDDRIFDRGRAEALRAKVAGKKGLASETRDESKRHAPWLFHLTGLQKYMAQRYKWSAKRTLDAAQRCYEQHKVLTYPRTSSSCLPADYKGEVDRLVQGLKSHPTYGAAARHLIEHGRENEKRVFDDSGVGDHFAIIPTGVGKALSGDDEKVYDAVVRRFLATFYPPAIYDRVKRLTVVADEPFRTGPVETLAVPGWLAVYDKDAETPATPKLPPLISGAKKADGVPALVKDLALKADQTKAPPRINEAGLLNLMENAGRQVADEEMAKALMSAEGLGTAATRADIIQNLKAKEYVDEALRPTFKGIHLIRTLHRLEIQRLTAPELTARLELELGEVEGGRRSAAAFMREIGAYVTEVVGTARGADVRKVYPDVDAVGVCPHCGKAVYERPLGYACGACDFTMAKDLGSRYLDRGTAALLLAKSPTPELDGFKDDAGKDTRGTLSLDRGRITVRLADGTEPEPPRMQVPVMGARRGIGKCPVHPDSDCTVVETKAAYMCTRRLAELAEGVPAPRGFSVSKMLCGRPISAAEVQILMERRATPELTGFVSKAGRSFSARLKLGEDGRAAFDFPERRARPQETEA